MSSAFRRSWPAALTAALTVVLGTVVVSPSAHAEDAPTLKLSVARSEVGLPLPPYPEDSQQISWGVENTAADVAAEDVVVSFDISGVSAFADFDSTCVDDLCAWDPKEIVPGDEARGLLDLDAKPDAALGATGTVRFFVTSSNAAPAEMTVKVTVGALGLGVTRIPDLKGAEPGSTLDAPIAVYNAGSLTADGVDLTLAATPGLDFAQQFANCTYEQTTGVPSSGGQPLAGAVCHLATPVAPGKRYRLSTPVGVTVKSTALYEFVDYRVAAATASAPADPSGGQVLGLVEDGSAPKPANDHAAWQIEADNTADTVLTGATADATPGHEAVLAAKVRNDGPAVFNLLNSDAQVGVLVEIPEGTTAVKIPPKCGVWTGGGTNGSEPGAPAYMCAVESPFTVGETVTFPFTVKVEQGAPATTSGELTVGTVWGSELDADAHRANNTARFTVRTTSSADGAAPTPTPTATASDADPDAGKAGGRATSVQTGTGAPAAGPTTSGTMAATGSGATPAIAAAGALALVAGGGVAFLARRRRTRTGTGGTA
ncbi:hypothetical protein [Streptomyces sp. AM 2-1-1]|uniref:hypothetical protein n=1 Tax=Streptomyces sp. AM 2-1-1 TaxID=3028709 RepID=UPI0023B8EDFB|nr:hypothetical protein [Streptomyces sp. AM 2-1-1]WEH42463.1 hypothetical protein PZB77_24835 [Streptomyces sp. AM 2-1-1]